MEREGQQQQSLVKRVVRVEVVLVVRVGPVLQTPAHTVVGEVRVVTM